MWEYSSTHSACPKSGMSHNHDQALWWGSSNCCGRSIILLWYSHIMLSILLHFQGTPFTSLELKPKENVGQIFMAFDAPLNLYWIGCSYKLTYDNCINSVLWSVMFQNLHVGGDIVQFCPFVPVFYTLESHIHHNPKGEITIIPWTMGTHKVTPLVILCLPSPIFGFFPICIIYNLLKDFKTCQFYSLGWVMCK